MEAGLDTGPMLLHGEVPIGPRTTTPELHDALAALGARLVLEALAEDPPAVPQPEEGATYAPKLGKADGRLDWREDAAALDRSEEHTSELQSRQYLVCRLLLEKKTTNKNIP